MTTSDLARLRATAEEVMRLNDDNMKRAAPKFARGVRQELAAGVVLRSGDRPAFGGKAKEAMSRITDGGETCQAQMKAAIEQFSHPTWGGN